MLFVKFWIKKCSRLIYKRSNRDVNTNNVKDVLNVNYSAVTFSSCISLFLSHVFIIMQIKATICPNTVITCIFTGAPQSYMGLTHVHVNWLELTYFHLSGLDNWDIWRRSVWGTLSVCPGWWSWGPVGVRLSSNFSPRRLYNHRVTSYLQGLDYKGQKSYIVKSPQLARSDV